MKRKILICGIILVVITAIGIVLSFNMGSSEENIKNQMSSQNKKIELGSGVVITEIAPYTGSFVEDGTDEFVENTLSITIENNGSEYVQLMNVTIDEEYDFNITTLLPGKKMVVLEQARTEYDKKINTDEISVSNVAFFKEKPTMHSNILEISGEDNRIEVKNISGDSFPGGRVFYKNKFEDKYIGGITYAATIPILKKDESIVIDTAHYMKDSSELIFVTYAK